MRRAAVLVVLGVVMGTLAVIAQPLPPYKDASLPIERRVADLLARMSLEEKSRRRWRSGSRSGDSSTRTARSIPRGPHPCSNMASVRSRGRATASIAAGSDGIPVKRSNSSTRSSVGSSSNAARPSPSCSTKRRSTARRRERRELPGPHRPREHVGSPLVERLFTIAAREARARGAQQVLSPVLDLARDPRWGRTEETYGEDPHLVA